MWLMILCSAVAGLNTAGTYKTFGATQPALNSDAYLSLVGSLSAILGNAQAVSSGVPSPTSWASSVPSWS